MPKAKGYTLTIRLDQEDLELIDTLIEDYGLRSKSELFRYALVHINETRPALGKSYRSKAAKPPATLLAN